MPLNQKNSVIDKCRVCGQALFGQPLLRYENMPSAAQCLPEAGSLKDDQGIILEICQCSGCGLVQLNSSPVPYYKEVIRAAAFSPAMKEFRINQFSDFVAKYSLTGKKIVEVGCGRGEYLTLMKQCGADSYGIEYSESAAKNCTENGLNVVKGWIADDKIKTAPFDAFFVLNFLEHLPDLNLILKGIRNNLTDDAVGIVEVPNFDMMLKNKLFSEFTRDHLFYFTKETLETVLKLNGFEIISCEVIWHDYIISAVVKPIKDFKFKPFEFKKITKLDLSFFHEYQMKIESEVKEYISRFDNKKVAIWGAGHQAFAVMSLFNLTDKIKYVVDSAIFKQNKYTPATHIPIVAPSVLESDPADAVIIIAGSYSDEVAKIIRQKYNKKITISILRDFGLEFI